MQVQLSLPADSPLPLLFFLASISGCRPPHGRILNVEAASQKPTAVSQHSTFRSLVLNHEHASRASVRSLRHTRTPSLSDCSFPQTESSLFPLVFPARLSRRLPTKSSAPSRHFLSLATPSLQATPPLRLGGASSGMGGRRAIPRFTTTAQTQKQSFALPTHI